MNADSWRHTVLENLLFRRGDISYQALTLHASRVRSKVLCILGESRYPFQIFFRFLVLSMNFSYKFNLLQWVSDDRQEECPLSVTIVKKYVPCQWRSSRSMSPLSDDRQEECPLSVTIVKKNVYCQWRSSRRMSTVSDDRQGECPVSVTIVKKNVHCQWRSSRRMSTAYPAREDS